MTKITIVQRFLKKISENESLKKKIKYLSSSETSKLISIAHDEGFNLTADDFRKFLSYTAHKNDELTDEELAFVSGGVMNQEWIHSFFSEYDVLRNFLNI